MYLSARGNVDKHTVYAAVVVVDPNKETRSLHRALNPEKAIALVGADGQLARTLIRRSGTAYGRLSN